MKSAVIILFLILTIFYFPNIKADIISINNGGNEGIVINPDSYVEGFFSCVPMTCAKLGYNCDSWSDSCGKILNCGTCSGTCTNGTCIAPITPPQGGGQTGGGASGTPTIPGIVITPSEINLTLSYNNVTNMSQRITEKIYVTNNGDTTQNLSLSQEGLDSVILLQTNSITVSSK